MKTQTESINVFGETFSPMEVAHAISLYFNNVPITKRFTDAYGTDYRVPSADPSSYYYQKRRLLKSFDLIWGALDSENRARLMRAIMVRYMQEAEARTGWDLADVFAANRDIERLDREDT